VLLQLLAGVPSVSARTYRQVRFVEQNGRVHLAFSFLDFFDARLRSELQKGFQKVTYLEAHVYRTQRNESVAIAVRHCKVIYDLWAGSYRIAVEDGSGTRQLRENTLASALKQIANVWLPLGPTRLFGKNVMHYVDVVILFEPLPKGFLAKVQRWLRQPAGFTRGDSPLGSRFSVFVNSRISRALKETTFRTQSFWWPGP
jgi:hypothetical protein